MSIDATHPEYDDHIDDWNRIDKACNAKGIGSFLIKLNPSDTSQDNKDRNADYEKRAIFYPISGATAAGLLGIAFSKKPTLEAPSELDYLELNADGLGSSIYQLSQKSVDSVNKKARSGLFTSFPRVTGDISQADLNSGKYFSTITHIATSQIRNWEESLYGSEIKLSLVVIEEQVSVRDDYKTTLVDQLMELMLIDGAFSVQLWRKNKDDEWVRHEESWSPLDGSGRQWSEIPFAFIGAKNNGSSVDNPDYLGMVNMNIGHYRNSADWEDSIFYAGQSQPWMSGVTQNHVDLMKKNKMYIGSKQMMGVPSGETFGFASSDPNPVVRQAMIDKVDMMIGMGARIMTANGQVKTATQSNADNAMQHSTLVSTVVNCSDAYTKAVKWAARYMSAPEDDIKYEIKKDFIDPKATAQEIQAMITGFLQGAIPISDYHRWMKMVDLTEQNKTLEDFSEEITAGEDMANLDEGQA